MKWNEVFRISALPVFVASLCCLSPIILVLFGLASVSFAASLADTLYGDYKWVFRAVGAALLFGSVYFYMTRVKGICTIDEAKKRRNEIINTIALTLVAGVGGYIIFLYGIVHYAGVFLHIWE